MKRRDRRLEQPLLLALLTVVAACAKAFGVDSETSTLTDFCQCSQLGRAEAQCVAFASAKENDIRFLRTFAARGCTECTEPTACYGLLGASPDGATCVNDGDCASVECCSQLDLRACCSSCRACSDPRTSPASHCTPLFDAVRSCLLKNIAACAMCPSTGPDAFDDDCYRCLAPISDACNMLRFQCQDES